MISDATISKDRRPGGGAEMMPRRAVLLGWGLSLESLDHCRAVSRLEEPLGAQLHEWAEGA